MHFASTLTVLPNLIVHPPQPGMLAAGSTLLLPMPPLCASEPWPCMRLMLSEALWRAQTEAHLVCPQDWLRLFWEAPVHLTMSTEAVPSMNSVLLASVHNGARLSMQSTRLPTQAGQPQHMVQWELGCKLAFEGWYMLAPAHCLRW